MKFYNPTASHCTQYHKLAVKLLNLFWTAKFRFFCFRFLVVYASFPFAVLQTEESFIQGDHLFEFFTIHVLLIQLSAINLSVFPWKLPERLLLRWSPISSAFVMQI